MELSAPTSSLRGEFSTSKFVCSISGPQRNGCYRSKKHRGGQPKQSRGGGGGGGESTSSTQGIPPRVYTSEMGGNASRGVATGRTTSAGSTVVPPSPAGPVASSRPEQPNGRRRQRRQHSKDHPNSESCSKRSRKTRSRQPHGRSHTGVSNNNWSKLAEKEECTLHPKIQRMSCSMDSGKGDDLSSSCESTVFEPTPIPGMIKHVHRDSPTDCKRHTSSSDVEEDVFVDALSKFPSELSSVYTTPRSTRSQSPIQFMRECSVEQTNSLLSCESSLKRLHNSLQRVAEQQEQRTCDERVAPEGSCDDHVSSPVTETPGHVIDHMNNHVTPDSPSECGTVTCSTRTSLGSASIPRSSEKTSVYVGDIELQMDGDETDEGVDFEVSISSIKSDVEGSSGISMSLSPKVAPRPGILHVPQIVRTADVHVQSPPPSVSSISTASPLSSSASTSVCSHPSSPLTLSPSPTPPYHETGNVSKEGSNGVTDSGSEKLAQELQERLQDSRSGQGAVLPDSTGKDEIERTCQKSGVNQEHEDEWPDFDLDCAQPVPACQENQNLSGSTHMTNMPHSESPPDIAQWFPNTSSHLQPPPPHLPHPPPHLQAIYTHPPLGEGPGPLFQMQSGYEGFYPMGYCWSGHPGFVPHPFQYPPPFPPNAVPNFPPSAISTFQLNPAASFPPNLTFHPNPPFPSHLNPPHPELSHSPHPEPSLSPRPEPSLSPRPEPSLSPQPEPSLSPRPEPSLSPWPEPSLSPRPEPSLSPQPEPSLSPRPEPSLSPRPEPSLSPRPEPSLSPRPEPSLSPWPEPSLAHPAPSFSPNPALSFPSNPVPSIHPLQDTWVMWHDKITGSTRSQFADYKASLNQLSTVGCVEDFWRLCNNIMPPSELEKNSNYHFFKENIQPLWEDQANKQGGKWVLTVREDAYGEVLDRTWLELLMALIGEHMSKSHLVNGAVVSRRKKGDRISLWTGKKSKKANLDICKGFIKVLSLACQVGGTELPGFIQQLANNQNGLSLVYMHHTDSLKSGSSYQNDARISLREHIETILEDLLR